MSRLLQERWDRKLVNWALWKVGQSKESHHGAPGDWWNCPPRPPQPLVGEALDTDDLVRELPDEQQEALTAWYVWTGDLQDRALFLGIHRDTLRDRVVAARWRLDTLDQTRRYRLQKTQMRGSAKCA